VAGQNCKKLTRSIWTMWCATGKFSNYQKFAADSKNFENFPTDSKKIVFFSRRFKKFDGELTHSATFSVHVAHCATGKLTRSAREGHATSSINYP
jgi:hypothetical protein